MMRTCVHSMMGISLYGRNVRTHVRMKMAKKDLMCFCSSLHRSVRNS